MPNNLPHKLPSNWPKIRLAVLAVAFALLIGLAGYSAWRINSGTSPTATASIPAIKPVQFALTDQNGQPVDESLFKKGKWTAVFFGYTYCPDFCPLTLQHLAATKQALGPKADDLQIVFISVDPARDTPENLKAYLNSGGFPPGVTGLTGTPAELDKVMKAFGAYAERKDQDGGYLMNHTVYVYLLDPKGESAGLMGWGMQPDQMADYITRIMK